MISPYPSPPAGPQNPLIRRCEHISPSLVNLAIPTHGRPAYHTLATAGRLILSVSGIGWSLPPRPTLTQYCTGRAYVTTNVPCQLFTFADQPSGEPW